MSGRYLEHVAGPTLGRAQLCSRCCAVINVWPDGVVATRPRFHPGARVASNGSDSYDVTGWPYTPCSAYSPRIGDRLDAPVVKAGDPE